MNRKPMIGLIGFSDGEPAVHEQLKEIVQKQVDVIAEELEKQGEIIVLKADRLVCSVESAKEEAEKLKAKNVSIGESNPWSPCITMTCRTTSSSVADGR